MTTSIGGAAKGGNWKHEHGTAHYGRNFSVKWLKLCELSFQKTGHLRNPYNENLPVKISRDCQELEASVGQELASLLYLEPDSELMVISLEAESKREEEKAKGVDHESGNENPDIVPFEDNEDEEEEESEEEDERFGQSFGAAALGRGSGIGMAWPSMVPLGARPPLPGMMADGFSYGALTPGGFTMGPRHFGLYGPRFSGDMMLHKRPLASGFATTMGAGRSPFMGAAGLPRAGQPPVSIGRFPPPSQLPPNSPAKIDQRAPVSDRNGRITGQEIASSVAGPGLDDTVHYQSKENAHQDDQFGTGNSFRNDEGVSEDEAPRRSRHGEGKKRRGILEKL